MSIMVPPPSMIDGADVMLYLSLSKANEPTEALASILDGWSDAPPAALAITGYTVAQGVQLVVCDREWRTLGDSYHPGVAEAKAAASALFSGISEGSWCEPARLP
ncbi:MAG TPA: hypothetical protein VD962_03315 [Rubricoccaceae bacterium]|nr:hypothetical protein [Rubricoccaceae bacterium]